MNTIKFSYNYPKLWNQTEAKLIFIGILPKGFKLDKDLIEYDTKNTIGLYYPLPKEALIQLVFIGNKMIPFCTLRRYTNEKFDYYSNKILQQFKIEIKEEALKLAGEEI